MKRILASLFGSLLFAAIASAQTPAKSLATTGAPVNVSQAAPPAGSGRACVTTNATHCTWQLLSGIGLLTVPVTTANGGTGADMSNALTFAKSADGDTATSTMFLSATDSGATTSNVSIGIELPNSVGVAGDYVVRTGGSGASGSGTEAFRAYAPTSTAIFGAGIGAKLISGAAPVLSLSEQGWDGSSDPTPPLVVTLGKSGGGSYESKMAAFYNNLDDGGNADYIQLGFSAEDSGARGNAVFEFQMSGNGDGGAWFGMNFDPVFGNIDPFKVWGNGAAGEVAVDINSGNPLAAPLAGIQARHATLPSAIFQTSATDGSNANPTAVFAGNTAQTAPLTEWRGTDGTTPVASMGITGALDAASYSVGALNAAPSTPTDTCTAGQIRWTADYIFLCVAGDTWKRAALSSWSP